jgi:hypothetical protein
MGPLSRGSLPLALACVAGSEMGPEDGLCGRAPTPPPPAIPLSLLGPGAASLWGSASLPALAASPGLREALPGASPAHAGASPTHAEAAPSAAEGHVNAAAGRALFDAFAAAEPAASASDRVATGPAGSPFAAAARRAGNQPPAASALDEGGAAVWAQPSVRDPDKATSEAGRESLLEAGDGRDSRAPDGSHKPHKVAKWIYVVDPELRLFVHPKARAGPEHAGLHVRAWPAWPGVHGLRATPHTRPGTPAVPGRRPLPSVVGRSGSLRGRPW